MSLFQIVSIILFIILLFIPIATFYKLRNRFNGFTLFTFSIALSFIIMSGLVIIRWYCYDLYLEYQISFLDRDGDGIWSNIEQASWSQEERKYHDKYFADGGRNVFAIFMFPIFSFVYSILTISIYSIILRIKKRKGKNS